MASTKSSTLKLLMQNGPRQGESLEFNSKVRIGRVVKGNNLTIKDRGISSNHLIIEFNKESGIWEIKDLDSSNGTILNSSQLKPLSPFEIRNGDGITIGELTSISIEIVPIGEETTNRRITRNRKDAIVLGSIKGSKLEIGDLKVDAKKEDEEECGLMRKKNTRRRKEVEFLGLEQVIQPKRTRRANNAGGVIPPTSVVEKVVEDKGFGMDDCKPTRGGRGRWRGRGRIKKHSIRSLDDVVDAFPKALEKEVPCENWADDKIKVGISEQKGGDPTLKGKNSAEPMDETTQQENGLCGGIESDAMLDDSRMEAAQDVVLEEKVNHEVLGKELPDQLVNSRHQPCKSDECVGGDQDVLEEKVNHEVLGQELPEQVVNSRHQSCEIRMDDKTNAQFLEGVVLDQEGGAQCVGEQHCAEEADGNLNGGSQAEERVCNGVESECDVVLNDGRVDESDMEEIIKESEVKCYDRSKDPEAINVPDLEKTTLAEWFDYLEVYLPKQIYAATDDIIKDMQKRAEQFDEFML